MISNVTGNSRMFVLILLGSIEFDVRPRVRYYQKSAFDQIRFRNVAVTETVNSGFRKRKLCGNVQKCRNLCYRVSVCIRSAEM